MNRKKFFYTFLITVVLLLFSEIVLRCILFVPSCHIASHRRAELYADYLSDDAYWLLWSRWNPAARPSFTRHGQLGWVGEFDPQTLKHPDESRLKGRTPVLLFGDSFSACVPQERCFEDILAEDPTFQKGHYVLNYGVGGYGLDQIVALLEHVLPLYPEAPVILGFMTLDVDRAHLRVREAQKPKWDVVEGQLRQTHQPQTDPLEIGIPSYIYRKFLYASFTPRALREVLINQAKVNHEKKTRMIHLLEKTDRLLADRLSLYLIFHPLQHTHLRDDREWRNMAIRAWLEDKKVPYLWSADIFRTQSDPELHLFIDSNHQHPTTHFNGLIAADIARFFADSD